MTMAKKRRPGVGAQGPAEAVATNDSSHSTRTQPQRKASYGSSGAYALSYAKTRGWYVFPAPVGEKKSHKSAKHSGGRNWGATIDEKEIKRDFKRWSKANIGVVTGPDSGIFVVEADTLEGHDVDGIASLEGLQQRHGELPQTLVAESPSGSLHYYFNYPADVTISNSTSKIAPGVDVRGAGGMVIAPPSRKPSGQQYRWLYDWPIADAPAWLIELCAAGDGAARKEAPDKPAEELLADDLDKLAYAVGVIPNDLHGYNEWKNFGMVVFAATGGSDFGFGLFDGFSKKWTHGEYDAANVQEAWQQIGRSPPKRVGAKRIYRRADEAAPGWRASYEEMRSAAGTAEDRAKAEEQKAKAKAREEELLAALVKAEGLDYERRRNEAKEELRVSARAIDNEVKARREDAAAAPLYGHWIVEPEQEPADGDSLLRDIMRRLRRHVVMSEEQALVVALFIMLSWVHDEAATHSPILNINSAEPESGKSTLIGVISFLMLRCISTVEASPAALYRAIKRWQPSFSVDEFDAVLADDNKQDLRAIVNSGHTRGTGVLRCIGEDKVPEFFSTFAPKVIGMIDRRRLPATTQSRSINIEMRRRKRDERIEKFEHADDAGLAELRSRLCRWSLDNVDALREAKPAMPNELWNRRGDNWSLLFSIADLCSGGEDFGEKARLAAVRIEDKADGGTWSVKALQAVKAILEDGEVVIEAIKTGDLIGKLTADDSSEWQEFRRGKPITAAQLAKLLKPFAIIPEKVTIDGKQSRGYLRARFTDAWARYLP
jgi:hypothetical protein